MGLEGFGEGVTVTHKDLETYLTPEELNYLKRVLGDNLDQELANLPQPPELGIVDEQVMKEAMLHYLKKKYITF